MKALPKNTAIGVDVRTGGFKYHVVDLVIPARGFDIRIERWHNSQHNLSRMSGWRFDWDERLEFDEGDGSVRYYTPSNRMSRFVPDQDGSFSPAVTWTSSSLARVPDGNFVLTLKGGQKRYFDWRGNLTAREDLFGNRLSFTWDSQSRIQQVRDVGGRVVQVHWENGDTRLRVVDWTGRELSYELYEPRGFIRKYTDPAGNVTTYSSGALDSAAGLPTDSRFVGITTLTLPNGLWLTNYEVGDRPEGTVVSRQVFANGRERRFAYDRANRTTTVTEDGRAATYKWDASGNLVEKTDPLGNRWTYEYDATTNRVETITDPNLATVGRTFDSHGNMVTRTNQKGRTWTYEYHPTFHQVTKITGPAPFNYVEELTYDAATGALLTRKDPCLKTTSYEHYPNGLLEKVTPPGPNPDIAQFSYDGFGNLVQAQNGLGKVTHFGYDAVGNQVSVTDPLGQKTTREFDLLGRVVLVRSPLGNTTRMVYDGQGNLVTVTDPLNRGTRFEYGLMDELARVVDPAGGAVSYSYDRHHNLVKQVDPNGHAYEFEYDELDRQTKVVDPMGQVTATEHSPYCGTVTTTDAEGAPTTVHRDVTCLVTERVFADGSAFRSSYDEEQRRTRMTAPQPLKFGQFAYGAEKYGYDPGDDTAFSWDGNHRLTQVTYPGSKSIVFGWDDAGRLSALTDVHGAVATYGYDAANRLTSVTRSTKVTSYSYDDANRLTLLTYPNGVTCDFTYDDDSRVTRMLWKKGVDTLYDIEYRYDRAGNRTRRKVTASPDPAVTEDFNYDALSRLVRVDENGVPRAQYRYDPAGNRLLKKRPEARFGVAASEEFSEYDASDELVATNSIRFRWDRVGQLVEKDDPAEANPTRYDWNYAHRLRKVTLPDLTSAEYRYNGDELRTWRKEPSGAETNYYWVPSGVLGLSQVLNELDGAGAPKANYVLGPNGLIAIIDGSGNERYYIFDALGSVLALTDAIGAVTDTYTYNEFGATLQSSGTFPIQVRFATQFIDSETRNYYLRNRFYSPDTGAFLRRDPLGPTFKAYQYAGNNPTNWTDPSGLLFSWQSIVGVISVGVGGVAIGAGIATGATPLLILGGVVIAGGFVVTLMDIVASGGDVSRVTKGYIRDTIHRTMEQTGQDAQTLVRAGLIPRVSDLVKAGFTQEELIEMGVVKPPHCKSKGAD